MYATYLKQEPNYFNTLMVIIYLNLYHILSLPLFFNAKNLLQLCSFDF